MLFPGASEMTGRQRLLSILNRAAPDRIAWTTLVDERTRSVMPPAVRAMPVLDFYRHIGCDILQFGNYGLPADLAVPSPARLVTPPIETEWVNQPDGLAVRTQRTPWGTLVATFRDGHPIKHPVESLEELRILKEVWLASRHEEGDTSRPSSSPCSTSLCSSLCSARGRGSSTLRVAASPRGRRASKDSAPAQSTGARTEGQSTEARVDGFARAEAAIGDDGLYIPTLDPSPVQQLIEMDMGLAGFYYHLQDHRAELESLLDAMHACRMAEYEIVARRSPAPALIPVENTSTTLISPALYRRYSLPQIRDYADIAHRHGKKLILHMCGKLSGLLGELAETGLDGINALTPPPVGDLEFEEALDVLGQDLIILGGILDPALFQAPSLTRDDLWQALDRLFTPRIRQAHFLLWLPADGLPTPFDRFLTVRDWMDSHGRH